MRRRVPKRIIHERCHRTIFAGLRQLREERGWSQEQLAERADLNRSYLGEVERGHAIPSLITVSKLAGALEIRLSSFIARCEHF